MKLLKKEDLYYQDYNWNSYTDDNPKISGKADSTLLNRKEGYEMLHFINQFCEERKLLLTNSARKVERMVREQVPPKLRKQEDIAEWIENHWHEVVY